MSKSSIKSIYNNAGKLIPVPSSRSGGLLLPHVADAHVSVYQVQEPQQHNTNTSVGQRAQSNDGIYAHVYVNTYI